MIRTLTVLGETGQRANRLNTHTCTHTRARKEVDSLALTLRSTISYIEAADWTATTTITDTTITKRRHPPRNTWRRLYRGERDAGRGGKRGRFFKSSHQGSILAWLNARAPHIESDLTRPRVFVGRPLSSSKFNYRYERETYFCADPTNTSLLAS